MEGLVWGWMFYSFLSVFLLGFLITIWKDVVFLNPIESSINPKIIYLEITIYTFFIILYQFLNNFVLVSYFTIMIGDAFYIGVLITSFVMLIIPRIYVRYKDKWKMKDLGIRSFSKMQNRKLAISSMIFLAL